MAEEKVGAKYVLRAIPDKCYEEAIEAKARGEMIGWSASNFPQEICTTLGIPVVYPESQAAQIAAKRGALPLLEHAEGDLGYSNDLCAYARISLAYADAGECPNGEREMPLPDFVLCCNNICNCMMKWYENLGKRLGIPVIMIDVPYSNDYDIDEKRIAYVGAQFRAAIKQLEEITGKTWDEDKFQEVCRRSSECGRLWLEAASYTNYKPSPVNGFELFNHMAVATVARGREESVEAFRMLIDDYRSFVANNESNWHAPENHRIMFEGIACWPYLRATLTPLKEAGVNTTAMVYGPAFGLTYRTFDEMVEAYCSVPNAVNLERSVELRKQVGAAGKIDGGLVHINRSCKMWSGFAPELARRVSADLGVPMITFDGDQADPRNFSEAQYQTRVEGLVEIMESNRKGA